jgi:phosphohistidine phosphatase
VTVRLHLLRHAKSSWDDDALADHDRPLAPRGIRTCKRLRRHLAAEGARPSLVICSTATRARQTLDLVLPALEAPAVAIESGVYLASVDTLLHLVTGLPDEAREVMVIGHNPGLHELSLMLTSPASHPLLAGGLPTGGLVTLDLPAGSWSQVEQGSATLVSFVKPRELSP